MIYRFLTRWLSFIVITRNDGRPYMTRFYLLGGPRSMRHGWFQNFNLFLHCFHSSDDEGELHNHPWVWAASLILWGVYREERPNGYLLFWPGLVNVIKADDYHRVDLRTDRVWSLFLAGPRIDRPWGFINRETGRVRSPWSQQPQ